jgi:diguanylate cyclase (GGDEF)-like protein
MLKDFLNRSACKNEVKTIFQDLFQIMPDGILVCKKQQVLFANPVAAKILEIEPADRLIGKSIKSFFTIKNWEIINLSIQRLNNYSEPDISFDIIISQSDFTKLHLKIVISKLIFKNENHHIFIIYDVTHQYNLNEKIKFYAYHDSLTELPNRQLLHDRLNQSQRIGKRKKLFGAIIYIDLDGFKTINDSFGHTMGDILLKKVGSIILTSVRESDTVSRVGGDEFIVLLSELSSNRIDAHKQALMISEKILRNINMPIKIDNHTHKIEASMGGVIFDGGSISSDELIKKADELMYSSKAAGRNRISFHDVT